MVYSVCNALMVWKSLMLKYRDLKKTHLFKFFNFSELDKEKEHSGLTRIKIAPGSFQEFIDIELSIDKKKNVHRALLLLDRDWIGDRSTLNPFAKDLVKSFISGMVPKKDREKANTISSAIMDAWGEDDTVLTIGHDSDPEDESRVEVREALIVFLGESQLYSLQMVGSDIIMDNIDEGKKKRLRIEISSW
ncbi:MAG: hypothetical protein ACW97A_05010 [Candidatus Thorarchaeota archaeon]